MIPDQAFCIEYYNEVQVTLQTPSLVIFNKKEIIFERRRRELDNIP